MAGRASLLAMMAHFQTTWRELFLTSKICYSGASEALKRTRSNVFYSKQYDIFKRHCSKLLAFQKAMLCQLHGMLWHVSVLQNWSSLSAEALQVLAWKKVILSFCQRSPSSAYSSCAKLFPCLLPHQISQEFPCACEPITDSCSAIWLWRQGHKCYHH